MENGTGADGEPRDGGARWRPSGGKPRGGRTGGMAGGEPGAESEGGPRQWGAGASPGIGGACR